MNLHICCIYYNFYTVFTYMFLYIHYKLYNNESQFFCAIKSQFFVFLLKFGKLVAYRRVRLCRFTTKQGGMQRRPAAKRERARRRARRRIICGIQRRFARILRIRYTKKRTLFLQKSDGDSANFLPGLCLYTHNFGRANAGRTAAPFGGQTKTVQSIRPARHSVYCLLSPG